MKILFYEIREFEFNYLLDKIPNTVEPYFLKPAINQSTFIDEKHQDAEALSVFVGSELNSETLSRFKNLKFIFLRCVGFSNVDLNYCKENNIYVFNTPNYGNSTVAEYTFALILSLSKKIIKSSKDMQQGEIDKEEITGTELLDKTIGVIGAGAIGKKVIEIARGFNMHPIVYDTHKTGDYEFVELDELFRISDFISINCPLTPTTRGLINREAFSKMKENVIITNTARGEIIDTEALYRALANKKIKGAALDVVECEEVLCQNWDKCTNNNLIRLACLKKFFFAQKLMQFENVIITPHNAYNTKEAQTRILNITLSNIQTSFNISSGAKNLVLI